MRMAARAPQTQLFLPIARRLLDVVRSAGGRWVPLLLIGVILLAGLGSFGIGQKVESWNAVSTIEIGTLPTIQSIRMGDSATLEPVENPRDLAARISAPQFQDAVFGDAQKALQDARSSFAGASLRAVVLSPLSIRLEASAGSKDVATALLQKAIAAIQVAHQGLFESRLELLRSVRSTLQEGKALLGEKSQNNNPDLPKSVPDTTAAVIASLMGRGKEVETIVDLDVRIAMLNYVERTMAQTRPQAGSAPSIEGPRNVNLVQRAILAGLGLLFFAVVLTFLLRRPAQSG